MCFLIYFLLVYMKLEMFLSNIYIYINFLARKSVIFPKGGYAFKSRNLAGSLNSGQINMGVKYVECNIYCWNILLFSHQRKGWLLEFQFHHKFERIYYMQGFKQTWQNFSYYYSKFKTIW